MTHEHHLGRSADGAAGRSCRPRRVCGLLGLALMAGASVRAEPPPPVRADQVWLAASNAQLSQLRGGFQVGPGLMVSFGFSREVYINDRLVSRSSLNLGQLKPLITQQMGRLSQAVVPQGDQAQAWLGQQAGLAAQLVQSGPGNVVLDLSLPWAAVVQNSVNGQQLRTQTIIDVSSNGLGALRLINLQNTLDMAFRARPGLR
jgi:hypothetical protein